MHLNVKIKEEHTHAIHLFVKIVILCCLPVQCLCCKLYIKLMFEVTRLFV